MPKVTMQFDLPEEESEMLLAQRGSEFYCAILEMQKEVRQHRKYDKKLEDCFERITQILDEVNMEGIS